MSRTRISDRLSEFDERIVATAEADLDRLLSLQPSPEFAAKVLARISAEHSGRGWRVGWVGLALLSTAALIIVGALTLRSGPGVRDGAVTSPRPVRPDIVLNRATSDKGGAVSGPRTTLPAPPKRAHIAADHVAGRSLETAPLRIAEPEVVIDPSLADAIRRLAISTRNLLLDDTTSDGNLQPASDVPLSSVVVEPLTVPELVLKPADQNGGR